MYIIRLGILLRIILVCFFFFFSFFNRIEFLINSSPISVCFSRSSRVAKEKFKRIKREVDEENLADYCQGVDCSL